MIELPASPPRDPALERAQARAIVIGAAAALVTLPLALYAHRLAVDPYHTPLIASEGRLLYLGSLLAAGAIGWLAARDEKGARAAGWALPAVTVFAALWMAGAYHRWPATLAAPVLAGSGVFVALFLRYLRDDGPETSRQSAALGETLLTNVVGLVAFSVILLHHSPVRYGMLAVFLVGAALYLAQQGAVGLRAAANASIVGLALAETTWALSYWQATGLELGAILQAIWYGLTTACLAQWRGELSRAALLRHSGVAVAVCLVAAILST